MSEEGEEEEFFEVEQIIDSRIDEGDGKYRYRIRWKGFGPEQDTWEPKENLSLCNDLLKAYKDERKRKKMLKKKKKAEIQALEIKKEPSESEANDLDSNDEAEQNETELEETGRNNDQSPDDLMDTDIMEGLTRKQRQQVRELLSPSEELPSPTDQSSMSSSVSPSTPTTASQSEFSTSFATTKKSSSSTTQQSSSKSKRLPDNDSDVESKRKTVKRKKVIESSDSDSDDIEMDVSNENTVLKDVESSNKKTQNKEKDKKKKSQPQQQEVTQKPKEKRTESNQKSTKETNTIDSKSTRKSSRTSSPAPNTSLMNKEKMQISQPVVKLQAQMNINASTNTTTPANALAKKSLMKKIQNIQELLTNTSTEKPQQTGDVSSPTTSSTDNPFLSENTEKIYERNNNSNIKGNSSLTKKSKQTIEAKSNTKDSSPKRQDHSKKDKIPKTLTNNKLATDEDLSNSNNLSATASKKRKNTNEETTERSNSTFTIPRRPSISSKDTPNNLDKNEREKNRNTTKVSGNYTMPSKKNTPGKDNIPAKSPSNSTTMDDVSDNVLSALSKIQIFQPSRNQHKQQQTAKQPPQTTTTKKQTTEPVENSDGIDKGMQQHHKSKDKQQPSSSTSNKSRASSNFKKNSNNTNSGREHDNTGNQSEKSRKLSLKEYQAKKQSKLSSSSADEGAGGMFIEFTRVPNTKAAATGERIKTSKSIDNATFIPPPSHPKSNKERNSVDSAPVVSGEQLATSTDVLGNILHSINPRAEEARRQPSRTTESIAIRSEQRDDSQEESDIILEEETSGNEGDNESDFETDLEECSSDEEMDTSLQNRGGTHCELPDANSKNLDHIVVYQCICAGDVDTLIKCQIKPNMINEYVDSEDTLLMKAVMECAPQMVKILLEKGSNPNICSKNGKTPLMIAVELRQRKLVIMLIQHGAFLNTKTCDGRSALDLACSSGSLEIVHVLLSNGADVRPTMQSLEQPNNRVPQVPSHMKHILFSVLKIQYDKLFEIVVRLMKDFVQSSKMQLDQCLMPIRCISPKEMPGIGHTLYFESSKVNVTEKHVNLVMIAIPVLFERNGQIVVKLEDANNNGVKEVIMNPGTNTECSNVPVLPNSNFLHILFPGIVGYNELQIMTDEESRFKILVGVFQVMYGKQTVLPNQREIASSNNNTAVPEQPTTPILQMPVR